MKLSRFIADHMEAILAEWEAFARTLLPAAAGMSPSALRDDAQQILEEIALDIETDQSETEPCEKSKGMEATDAGSAASKHGRLREDLGFTLIQLNAEYRALRASVLRLWLDQTTQLSAAGANDIIRFNEAIDQALTDSAVSYSNQVSRTRDTFLAILGHDLRNPLAAMVSAGDFLTMPEMGTDSRLQIGARVKRSAATMTTMMNDLLEYARTQLGGKMRIASQPGDMKDICEAALDDVRAVHPDCPFDLEASGDLRGSFDDVRLEQVLTNLLNNAAQYRATTHPVLICALGEADEVTVSVRNFGPVIPPESLQVIFSRLFQSSGNEPDQGQRPHSLGLGLFIAREITVAHGGTVSAESSESSGTVFTVRLPRRQAPPQ